jgi:hypothetical protein
MAGPERVGAGAGRRCGRAAWVLAALAFPAAAPAQPQGPDLNTLALLWTRGDFRAPLVCEIDGEARRGFRRIQVGAGPQGLQPPANRVRFHDLEVPPGSRCIAEARGPVPNVSGSLTFRRRGPSRVDTARHDFEQKLRREGGFDFEVLGGRLRAGPSEDPAAAREIEMKGGRVRFVEVERGSDAWRRLVEFPGRRLRLLVEAPDGTALEFDLVDLEPR